MRKKPGKTNLRSADKRVPRKEGMAVIGSQTMARP